MDYTLTTLSRSLLGEERLELPPSAVPGHFDSADGVRGLVLHCETDAWLALGLSFNLAGVRPFDLVVA